MSEINNKWAEHIGWGIAWMGFWIGLGLYNFQGCVPHSKQAVELNRAWDEGKPNE